MPDQNKNLDKSRWEFLIDASPSKAGREYAVYFDRDNTAVHIDAYDADGRKLDIQPDEVIFAVDPWRQYDAKRKQLDTTVYQINIDDKGRIGPDGMLVADIGFNVITEYTEGPPEKISLDYYLTPMSFEEMKDAGFNTDFPPYYSADVTAAAAGGAIQRNSDKTFAGLLDTFVGNLSFPPHHKGGTASVARAMTDETRPPHGLAEAFNSAVGGEPENPKIPRADFEAALKEFGQDRTEMARQGLLPKIAGREGTIRDVMLTLTQRDNASVCLIGESGVGKTAVVDGVTQKIAEGDCPPALKGARVLRIDLSNILATENAMWRGQVEKTVKAICLGNGERHGRLDGQKLIFVFDELPKHLAVPGAVNQIKDMLMQYGVATIATTTFDEFEREVEPLDGGSIASRFEQKIVEPPTGTAIIPMAASAMPGLCDFHHVERMSAEELEDLIAQTERHSCAVVQPKRTAKVIDLAGASAAARLSKRIEQEDIAYGIATLTGQSREFIKMTDYERVMNVQEHLPETILGQTLDAIPLRLAGSLGGLSDQDKPLAVYIFPGPTGVGKTETAKAIAKFFFGDENAYARHDMGQFKEPHTISRLIGAPAGYVGHKDTSPELYEDVRRHPGGLVILLDEIEKAHTDLHDPLLGIFDSGEARDNKGRKVNFRNTIIIMTSNLGVADAAMVMRKGSGIAGFRAVAADERNPTGAFLSAAGRHFKPEFLARVEQIGGIVVFQSLTQQIINQLAVREIDITNKRLIFPPNSLRGAKIELSESALRQLQVESFDPVYNARPVKAAVNRLVNDPMSLWLLDPRNKEVVKKAIKQHGGARLVIDSFSPRLQPRIEAPVTNDNENAPDSGTMPVAPSVRLAPKVG